MGTVARISSYTALLISSLYEHARWRANPFWRALNDNRAHCILSAVLRPTVAVGLPPAIPRHARRARVTCGGHAAPVTRGAATRLTPATDLAPATRHHRHLELRQGRHLLDTPVLLAVPHLPVHPTVARALHRASHPTHRTISHRSSHAGTGHLPHAAVLTRLRSRSGPHRHVHRGTH